MSRDLGALVGMTIIAVAGWTLFLWHWWAHHGTKALRAQDRNSTLGEDQ